MKRIVSIAAALLLVLLLSACGSGLGRVRTPYLSTADRTTLEKSIMDSARIAQTGDQYYPYQIRLENQGKQALTDVTFRSFNNNNFIGYISHFFPGEKLKLDISGAANWMSDEIRDDRLEMIFYYTIGEYTYTSERFFVPVEEAEIGEDMEIEIQLELADGPSPMIINGNNEFRQGDEIQGLASGKIYGIESTVEFQSYNGSYEFRATLEGKEPKDYGRIVYKMLDSEGLVLDSDSLYWNDDGTSSIYGIDLEPGSYTLRFEEKR